MKSNKEPTYEDAPVGQFGHRFCSTCYAHVSSEGGMWRISANKKNKRWVCKSCMSKRIKATPIK